MFGISQLQLSHQKKKTQEAISEKEEVKVSSSMATSNSDMLSALISTIMEEKTNYSQPIATDPQAITAEDIDPNIAQPILNPIAANMPTTIANSSPSNGQGLAPLVSHDGGDLNIQNNSTITNQQRAERLRKLGQI